MQTYRPNVRRLTSRRAELIAMRDALAIAAFLLVCALLILGAVIQKGA